MLSKQAIARRFAHGSVAAFLTVAAVAALALPAAAERPDNTVQGSVSGPDALPGGVVAARVAFSAWSDPTFQETHGTSGSAGGMMNFQPNVESNALVPPLGRVQVSCLDIEGNEAIMTGTVSVPISTNAYTGPPYNRPANWWIVGAYLLVIDNGPTEPPQLFWGFFVNPDKDHVISSPRCFLGGLAPSTLLPADDGHVNVYRTPGA